MVKRMNVQDRKLEALPDYFEPGEFDAICARGKMVNKHPGNLRFLSIVKGFLKRYSESSSRVEKSDTVSEIIAKVEQDGCFAKKVGDAWFLADLQLKREKVAQALRNQLSCKYKSSTKAKRMQRKVKESMFDDEVEFALSQIKSEDMMEQAEKLTSEAKDETDLLNAFNQLNAQLLQRLKSLPPMLSRGDTQGTAEDDEEEEEENTSDLASVASEATGNVTSATPTQFKRGPSVTLSTTSPMARVISESSTSGSSAAMSTSSCGPSVVSLDRASSTPGVGTCTGMSHPFPTSFTRTVSGVPSYNTMMMTQPLPPLARSVTSPTESQLKMPPTKASHDDWQPLPVNTHQPLYGSATNKTPLDLEDDDDDDSFCPLPFDYSAQGGMSMAPFHPIPFPNYR